MNRRRFIQSVVTVCSFPAVPVSLFKPAAAALPTAAAVPAHARSWAIYMSTLHGECTPQALQNLLNIPAVDANSYVTQLIADGAIKPNPLLHKTVSELIKPKDRSFLDRVKKRLEMKANLDECEPASTSPTPETLDVETEVLDDFSETYPADVIDDDEIDDTQESSVAAKFL